MYFLTWAFKHACTNCYMTQTNKGGIYRIRNTINERQYIGSTYKFRTRWNAHLKDLNAGTHHCKFLQRDFDKCGNQHFVFEIIQVVDNVDRQLAKETRYDLEDRTIKELVLNLGRAFLYNGYLDVRRTSHKPQTDERKHHMHVLMTEVYKDPARIKQASLYSQKRWKTHSVNICVTNKVTGQTVLIDKSLRSWCIEQGLSYKAFHLMVNGKTKSSNGWVLFNQ